jgi:hypothetical protein
VTFEHGGLNHSVDTLTEVVKEYSSGRAHIRSLRRALRETRSVLVPSAGASAASTAVSATTSTSNASNGANGPAVSLRELYLKKVELQESLRIVRDLETLKVGIYIIIYTL